jgi:hypothetical protein
MGMGVVQYCTPEGGSGFIANPSLPWLSSFDITQMAPVYDQETAWLRNSEPGSYTNYPRFGPPYSVDGGVLPPYGEDPLEYGQQPVPVQVGCSGLGAVDPDQFEAQYGRPEPPESTCLQIQCGAIPQSVAGMQLIQDCANAGWSGARSCSDPACSPWVTQIPGCGAPAPGTPAPVLLRSQVVAPMPSITTTARTSCTQPVSGCPGEATSWIEANPWLAVGLAVGIGALLFGGVK